MSHKHTFCPYCREKLKNAGVSEKDASLGVCQLISQLKRARIKPEDKTAKEEISLSESLTRHLIYKSIRRSVETIIEDVSRGTEQRQARVLVHEILAQKGIGIFHGIVDRIPYGPDRAWLRNWVNKLAEAYQDAIKERDG